MKKIYFVNRNQYDHSAVDSIYSTYQFAVQRINQLYEQLKYKYIDDDEEGEGYSIELSEDNQIRVSFEGSVVCYVFIKQKQITK